jgi:hypothetical protein
MPIGYYNFGNIQQGNQQVANSMAGLGQQIAGAIETHAATQSAQAMLPMLQQQYANGVQKIAQGKQDGMIDIIQAASLASKNPLTAKMGQQMIDGMTQLSRMANTQAYLQGTRLSSMATHPEMYNPDGTLNTSRLGQAAPARPMTAYQQEQLAKNAAESKNNQINEYGALYSGDPSKNIDGIGSYASKINEAISNGDMPDAKNIQGFASMYSIYKQKQAAYGANAVTNPQIESAFKQIQGKIPQLKGIIKKEQEKGTGNWFGNTDLNKVETLIQGIEQLKGLQSAGGSVGGASTSPNQDALILSAQKAIKNGADPKAVQERLNQLIQQMRTPAQQSAPAMPTNQPNSQIPAASGAGNAGTEEENPQQQAPVEENESED